MLGDLEPRGKVRDGGVTSVFQAEHRTMTAFILAVIVNNYNTGQVSVSHPVPLQRRGPGHARGGQGTAAPNV